MFSRCCRLCLSKDKCLKVDCCAVQELSEIIKELFNITITNSDECSKKICETCFNTISGYYIFKKRIVRNQEEIKNYQNIQKLLNFNIDNNVDQITKKEIGDDDDVVIIEDSEETIKNTEASNIVEPAEELLVEMPSTKTQKNSSSKNTSFETENDEDEEAIPINRDSRKRRKSFFGIYPR